MKTDAPSYHGYRFPPEIISHAVWLYHRFCVSFRNVEELLAQRGITVSYEAVRLWCIKFGPEYARRLKRRLGDRVCHDLSALPKELRLSKIRLKF